jgi:hypothetical protein
VQHSRCVPSRHIGPAKSKIGLPSVVPFVPPLPGRIGTVTVVFLPTITTGTALRVVTREKSYA